jgi:hypothetical protein
MVAVKQLTQDGVQGRNEFLVEVLMLTMLNHRNLVSLVGFCAQGDERLLVYDYMPFGSLESHLFGNLSSTWNACLPLCCYGFYYRESVPVYVLSLFSLGSLSSLNGYFYFLA